MADRNRTFGLQRATERSAASWPMAMKARDRLAPARICVVARYEWFDGALCRRHAAGSGRLCPPGPRRLAPHELADADAGSRRQPRARRRSRAQQGGGGRVARNLRDGERLWIDEIGQHGGRRRVIADTYLHLRLLFQPLGGERGDQRRRGERGFRRQIRGRQNHAADLVNHSPGDVFGQCSNQRVRGRRRRGRRFCRNDRLFGRADLRLQPLRIRARDR